MVGELLFWSMLISILAFGGLANVVEVGKPRKPQTPAGAAAVVAVDALLIVGIVAYGIF